MKAASGELNLTIITVVAIAALLGFLMWFLPGFFNDINDNVRNQTNQVISSGN